MEMEKDVRQESSVPVQARVSIVDLARLLQYWEEKRGVRINNMGQLVSWSLSGLVEFLNTMGSLPEGINSVTTAHQYLSVMRMYQPSMLRRSKKKIAAAMQLEALRGEKADLDQQAPLQYRNLHNRHSVQVYDEEKFRRSEPIDFRSPEEVKADEERLERQKEQAIEAMRAAGKLVDEPEEERMPRWKKDENGKFIVPEGITSRAPEKLTDGELREFVPMRKLTEEELRAKEEEVIRRDKERIALENAPINEEDWPVVDE